MQTTEDLIINTAKETLSRYYKKIHYVCTEDWTGTQKLFNKVKDFKIKNHTIENYEKTAIIILHGEPFYYIPNGSIPLQAINLFDIIQKCQIFSTDFFLFGDTEVEKHMADFLNNAFKQFSNNFYYVPIDNFYTLSHDFYKELTNNNSISINDAVYNFCYFGKNIRTHRNLFAKFLIKENLYSTNLVSFSNPANNDYKMTDDEQLIPKQIVRKRFIGIPSWNREQWIIDRKILDDIDHVELFDYRHKDDNDNPKKEALPVQESIKKSCVCIVSETIFDYPFPRFTEKLVQAILVKRPFIIIGAHGSLEKLKSMGFRTFSSIFDETYDTLEDPNSRFCAITELVKNIAQQDIKDLKKKIEAITQDLEHNYKLFYQKREQLQNCLKSTIIKLCQ